jgi:hypothetical protein
MAASRLTPRATRRRHRLCVEEPSSRLPPRRSTHEDHDLRGWRTRPDRPARRAGHSAWSPRALQHLGLVARWRNANSRSKWTPGTPSIRGSGPSSQPSSAGGAQPRLDRAYRLAVALLDDPSPKSSPGPPPSRSSNRTNPRSARLRDYQRKDGAQCRDGSTAPRVCILRVVCLKHDGPHTNGSCAFEFAVGSISDVVTPPRRNSKTAACQLVDLRVRFPNADETRKRSHVDELCKWRLSPHARNHGRAIADEPNLETRGAELAQGPCSIRSRDETVSVGASKNRNRRLESDARHFDPHRLANTSDVHREITGHALVGRSSPPVGEDSYGCRESMGYVRYDA